jgi:hypothetical protein
MQFKATGFAVHSSLAGSEIPPLYIRKKIAFENCGKKLIALNANKLFNQRLSIVGDSRKLLSRND